LWGEMPKAEGGLAAWLERTRAHPRWTLARRGARDGEHVPLVSPHGRLAVWCPLFGALRRRPCAT